MQEMKATGTNTDNSSRVMVFFFNDTATTEIYTLSLHDALPICSMRGIASGTGTGPKRKAITRSSSDRKSTRLNSSHPSISYAVFCLKKKNLSVTTMNAAFGCE